jgi:hypothetical protein
MKLDSHGNAISQPDWASVPAPEIFSPLWLLERMAAISVPMAGLGLLAIAHYLDLFSLPY